MGHSRVRSFISAFSVSPRSKSAAGDRGASVSKSTISSAKVKTSFSNPSSAPIPESTLSETVNSARSSRAEPPNSRPWSMGFAYTPPLEFSEDTLPELQPILTFMSNHGTKLYHEGYFLKLNDMDSHGRPCPDRQWVECYAQLMGTVLAVWDAAALDAAEHEGDVPPTYINVADASIKMIESLPTRNSETQPLKNVLSISSAGKNRYLLHFNSFHSLIQWTAGIRLAMFEHTSLSEAYTGSIIAGKGKSLNSIRAIMEPSRFKHADWARVRFGAGTPWRRCWFVITPPDEKEAPKLNKAGKRSAYDRAVHYQSGDIKFYESKKTKKAQPIATITNVFSAHAVYPQFQPLIDQSTLIKLEGQITIHSRPESTTEGFVFVMPEIHPAVSGFEMLLRFLFPTFDTFSLYGRPTRLIADTKNTKSIMFSFPKNQRDGYLDILDVASLLQTTGSQKWSEAEWRKQLKDVTARRMANSESETSSVASKAQHRRSLNIRSVNPRSRFSRRSVLSPEGRPDFNQSADAVIESPREEVGDHPVSPISHTRGHSDITGLTGAVKLFQEPILETFPDTLDHDQNRRAELAFKTNAISKRSSSESDRKGVEIKQIEAFEDHLHPQAPLSPVVMPPAFAHKPGEVPLSRPQPTPELSKVNNRISQGTLAQIASAGGNMSLIGAAVAWGTTQSRASGGQNKNGAMPRQPLPSEAIEIRSDVDQPASPSIQGPPVPKHGYPTNYARDVTKLPESNKAIQRKPLQSQNPAEHGASAIVAEHAIDDFNYTIDEEALNRVPSHRPSAHSPGNDVRPDEDSIYEQSTASPDYASTHESIHSDVSVQKPRVGVMKTVGEVPKQDLIIGDVRYAINNSRQQESDIPAVDFGPTLAYLPTIGRPSTSEALTKLDRRRKESDASRNADRKNSIGPHPGERRHSRGQSNESRRSTLWQPGMSAARSASPGLTPEQFVQQRMTGTPLHMRRRSSSTSPLPARPKSADWQTHLLSSNPQFNFFEDPQPRPHSRGSSSLMNFKDISSRLSAREQEYVARMAGSSFFNLSTNNSKQEPSVQPAGLVGLIDARERERRAMKEGMSNQMVQHAIAQRQMQLQEQQLPSGYNYDHNFATPSSSYDHYQFGNGQQNAVYNLPRASKTWDAVDEFQRTDQPRRQSLFGP